MHKWLQWIQYSSVVVKNDRVYSLLTTPARTRPVHMRSTHNMSWVHDTYWASRFLCRPSRNDGCLQVVRDISHGYTGSQVGRMVRLKIVSFLQKSKAVLATESIQPFRLASQESLDPAWEEFEPTKILKLLFEPNYRSGRTPKTHTLSWKVGVFSNK